MCAVGPGRVPGTCPRSCFCPGCWKEVIHLLYLLVILIPVSTSTLSRASPHDEWEHHGRFWKWAMIRGALGDVSWETVAQVVGARTSEMGQLRPLGLGQDPAKGGGRGGSQ